MWMGWDGAPDKALNEWHLTSVRDIKKSVISKERASKCRGRFPRLFLIREKKRGLGTFVGMQEATAFPTAIARLPPSRATHTTESRTQSSRKEAPRTPDGLRAHPTRVNIHEQ